SLQIIRDGVAACLKQFASAFAADHSIGECIIELEWRADGKRKLPNPHSITVTKLDDRQIFRVNLNDSDIRFLVSPHHRCWKIPSVSQLHVDFVRAFHYVKIREDVAIGPHDETRAFAAAAGTLEVGTASGCAANDVLSATHRDKMAKRMGWNLDSTEHATFNWIRPIPAYSKVRSQFNRRSTTFLEESRIITGPTVF